MSIASVPTVTAILKTKYPDGKLPKAQYEKFPTMAMIAKKEDFDGLNKVIAVQTENPQGSSSIFSVAQGALQQGAYYNFLISRVPHYGIVRIKGEALKAAENNTGALVDLWVNETKGAAETEMKMNEIYLYGQGNGVLGQISSTSNIATATFTLTTPTDITKFDLGMSLDFVGDTTYSPAYRPVVQQPKIVAIYRSTVAPSITVQGNLNSLVGGVQLGDYICRAGDYATGGNPSVLVGFQGYIVGGPTPSALFGLTRSVDPTRLAGQQLDCSQYTSMEEAIIEMEGQVNVQGKTPDLMWANPRDVANLKKSLGGKATYPRTEVESADAKFSFTGILFEGTNNQIKIMTSPFCPRNTVNLLQWDSWALESLGPAPQLLKYDGVDYLRVATDDALEGRWGQYAQCSCNMPVANMIGINWGL